MTVGDHVLYGFLVGDRVFVKYSLLLVYDVFSHHLLQHLLGNNFVLLLFTQLLNLVPGNRLSLELYEVFF